LQRDGEKAIQLLGALERADLLVTLMLGQLADLDALRL